MRKMSVSLSFGDEQELLWFMHESFVTVLKMIAS